MYPILNYLSFPPQTNLKPQLTIRKPIKSPVLSPILLQIYCIGLIGLIGLTTHFFWVWAAICDPTKVIEQSLVTKLVVTLLSIFLLDMNLTNLLLDYLFLLCPPCLQNF